MIEDELLVALAGEDTYTKKLRKAILEATIPGGKRWRPLMLISIYEMLCGFKKNNRNLPDAISAACAVELLHNAALIHDDLPIVMNNKERRGAPVLHLHYDNVTAILAADALYAAAFEEVAKIKNPAKATYAIRVLATYGKSYGLVGGQAVALANKRKVMKISTLRYIDMKKVGSLLQASADIACNLAGADDNIRMIMNNYALNLGIAYMMIEDIEADYSRGSDGLDFSEDYVPVSKTSYTGLLGFDKARKQVDTLLLDCERSIKPFPHNAVLLEFIQMIKERLP